jgi:geranylgeranyl reductase family protein
METTSDVLVVGAGPAGASTAFHLARAGVRVTLVDRARFPRSKPCAEYLSPEASRVLHAMGVLEQVERSGAAQLTGMRIRAPNGAEFEGRFLAAHGYRGFRDRGLAIPRIELDAMLLNAARHAGVSVIEHWHVTEVERDHPVTRVTGTDASGTRRTICASVVVGADGLRSVVARRAGLARRSRLVKRFAVVAHFAGVRGIGQAGEMHVQHNGYVGLADVGHSLTNVAMVVPAALMSTARTGAERFMLDWLQSHPHLAPRFRDARIVGEVRATGPFASSAKRVWAPGVALVGDAAEFFDPFTGEGVYSALRGGELLAPFVEAAVKAPDSADAALRAYAKAHRAEFRSKRIVEQMIGFAVAYPAVFNRAARVLSRRQEMADLLIGVVGDFIPARTVLHPKFLFTLFGTAA